MTTILTAGLSLKPQHYDAALDCLAEGLWFDMHPEDCMVGGGLRPAWLEAIRVEHPAYLRGVAMLGAFGLWVSGISRMRRVVRFWTHAASGVLLPKRAPMHSENGKVAFSRNCSLRGSPRAHARAVGPIEAIEHGHSY